MEKDLFMMVVLLMFLTLTDTHTMAVLANTCFLWADMAMLLVFPAVRSVLAPMLTLIILPNAPRRPSSTQTNYIHEFHLLAQDQLSHTCITLYCTISSLILSRTYNPLMHDIIIPSWTFSYGMIQLSSQSNFRFWYWKY